MLTGSKVDNVFREMRASLLLPETSPLIALRKKPKPNIEDYRKAYEPIYRLSAVEVTAAHGLTNYGRIKPFDPFLPKKYPAWWQAYNRVKHGSYEDMCDGTLDNLVHAVGALFVLNVIHKDSQYYLLQRQVILPVPGYRDEPVRFPAQFWNIMQKSFVGLPGDVSYGAIAHSEVFSHAFRRDDDTLPDKL